MNNCFHHKNIFNTNLNLIDLWISCLVLFCGLHLWYFQPIENIIQYYFLLESGVSSNRLGLFAVLVGSSNILRIFRVIHYFKNCDICQIGLQCCNFLFCMILFLSVLSNEIIPMGAVFYGMVSLLSIVVLIKEK